MTARVTVGRAVEAALLAVAVLLLLGQLLGQPVLLAYVQTGSMAPTLAPGDGYVAIPAAIAGPVGVGDVVAFRAERVGGGGLTTHRIVGVTDRGYVTRGDANAFTDQASRVREPPVGRSRVVAKALAVGGRVVVIPGLGLAVGAVAAALAVAQRVLVALVGPWAAGSNGLALVLVLVGATLYLGSVVAERYRRPADVGPAADADARSIAAVLDGASATQLLVGLALVLSLSATASMVLPGGTHGFGVVSAENDAPGARVIQHGTTEATTVTVTNGGLVPVVVYLDPSSEGVTVASRTLRLGGRSRADVAVDLTAPAEIGYYRRSVVERRYLAVLPRGALRALYGVHPWAPIVAIDALLGGAVVVVGRLLLAPPAWLPTSAARARRRD